MKTKYLTIAAAAFMLASCSNDEDFVPQDDLKDTPITVTAGVAELTTRAGHDADNLPAKFYMTVIQDEADPSSKYNYTNVEMTRYEQTFQYTTTTTLLWKDADRDPFVSAYTIEGDAFTVQTDQSTAENVILSDLLGAVSTTDKDITITDDNIGFNFRHLLCKLDVTFSWGTELSTATAKTIKSVEYRDFGTEITLDREACTIANGAATADIQAYLNGNTSEAIFAPYIGTDAKVIITATIDGVDRMFSIGVTAPEGGFASSNRYTMNVTIGGTSVEDDSVTATLANGWETGDANGDTEGTTGNMATN